MKFLKSVSMLPALTLLILLCDLMPVQAQGDYAPLSCAGPMPADFRTGLEAWQKKIRKYTGNLIADTLITDEEYLQTTSLNMMEMLYSGDVLYGDVLTEYVRKVASEALRGDAFLHGMLRFYVVKSTDFNAYSTQNGIIFVTTGLLARIENEAQLAYIICHEAAHYSNNHNYKTTVFRNSTGRQLAKDKKARKGKMQMTMMEFSRENELEADREGLRLYRLSPYALSAVDRVFPVMLYAYLPFAELKFDTAYFNTAGSFRLPPRLFREKLSSISAEEDVPDSMRTHPNILKRRAAVRAELGADPDSSGALFRTDPESFRQVQKVARHECTYIHISSGETEEAFYSAYLLEKIYGRSLFTSKVMAAALYLSAKQKNHKAEQFRMPFNRAGSSRKVNVNNAFWETVEGESQAVYFLFSQLNAREMNILAARMMYLGIKNYGDDFFRERFDDLTAELDMKHQMNAYSFYPPAKSAGSMMADGDCGSEGACDSLLRSLDIYRKAIEKASESGNYSSKSYFLYAFEDVYFDHELNPLWREKFAFRGLKEQSFAYARGWTVYEKSARGNASAALKKESAPVASRMSNHILLIYPSYRASLIQYVSGGRTVYSYLVRDRKVDPVMLMQRRDAIYRELSKYALMNGLTFRVTGLGCTDSMDTEMFNEYCSVLRWMQEKSAFSAASALSYNHRLLQVRDTGLSRAVYCEMNNVGKSLQLEYAVFDLKTGEMLLYHRDESSKGKPGDARSSGMLRKAVKMTAGKGMK